MLSSKTLFSLAESVARPGRISSEYRCLPPQHHCRGYHPDVSDIFLEQENSHSHLANPKLSNLGTARAIQMPRYESAVCHKCSYRNVAPSFPTELEIVTPPKSIEIPKYHWNKSQNHLEWRPGIPSLLGLSLVIVSLLSMFVCFIVHWSNKGIKKGVFFS